MNIPKREAVQSAALIDENTKFTDNEQTYVSKQNIRAAIFVFQKFVFKKTY